eukprot:654198-Amphidinium_carterae.2
MLPKDGGGKGDPGALRPISVLSVFFRLWAKYRFYMLKPELRSSFPDELRGGIKNRDSFGVLLALMLRMEDQLVAVARAEAPFEAGEGDGELPWSDMQFPVETHVLTIDARKCYDRIPLHDALNACLERGMPDIASDHG